MVPFTGSGVIMITPFSENSNQINYDVVEQLIEFHLLHNTSALFCLTPYSEVSTFSVQELEEYIRFLAAKIKQRIPLFLDINGLTPLVCDNTVLRAQELGADGFLAPPPLLQRYSQKALVEYYRTLTASTSLPVILYNRPTIGGNQLTPRTLAEIANTCGIAGFVDSMRNQSGLVETLSLLRENIPFYGGSSDTLLPSYALGAVGSVTLTANIFPHAFFDLWNLCHQGRFNDARTLQINLSLLCRTINSDYALSIIKAALRSTGYNVGDCRPPHQPLDSSNLETLQKILKNYGLIH